MPQNASDNSLILTLPKRCSVCGQPLRNDTYGGRCEDCYVDGSCGLLSAHRGPVVHVPIPEPKPRRKKKKDVTGE